MKKVYSRIFILALTAFVIKASAQCTSCTTTISGTDASAHFVTAGTTLCVSPTGVLSGPITIFTGGTLCNQGTVSSGNVWVNGGNFANYGTLNISNVLVSNAGGFNNFGPAVIDSLLITETASSFSNHSTLTDVRMAVTDGGNALNLGTITCDYLGDSLGTFNNSMNLTINYDFYNAYNSSYTSGSSNSYLRINRSFYNSTGSTVNVGACMVYVGQDWYNSAIIEGPAAMGGHCAGFNISGLSFNSGTVGAAGQHVDLCDAGHPAAGIDGNSGTIAASTTYCICANTCAPVGIFETAAQSDVLIETMYPNPAVDELSVIMSSKVPQTITVEVYDMMGRRVMFTTVKTNIGENKATVDASRLTAGTYILSITDEKQLQAKQMFNVVK